MLILIYVVEEKEERKAGIDLFKKAETEKSGRGKGESYLSGVTEENDTWTRRGD